LFITRPKRSAISFWFITAAVLPERRFLAGKPSCDYYVFIGSRGKADENKGASAIAAQKIIWVIARRSLDYACGQYGIALATAVDQTNSNSIPSSNSRDHFAYTTASVVSSSAQARRIMATAACTRRQRRIVTQSVVTSCGIVTQLSTSLNGDSARFKALRREGSPPFESSSWRP
jgi:hypothetical protein